MIFAAAPVKKSVVAKADRYFEKKELSLEEIEACTVEDIESEVAKWDAASAAAPEIAPRKTRWPPQILRSSSRVVAQ